MLAVVAQFSSGMLLQGLGRHQWFARGVLEVAPAPGASRWLCEESWQSWRAQLAAGSIPRLPRVLDCIETMEKLLSLLSSWRLEDGQAQQEAIDKSSLLSVELLGHANEARMVSQFAKVIVNTENKWAALIEALIEGRWLKSDASRSYAAKVTNLKYSRDVRPDLGRRHKDSQGFNHYSGPSGRIKDSDALHGFNATKQKQDDAPLKPEELTFDHEPPCDRILADRRNSRQRFLVQTPPPGKNPRADCISMEEIVGSEDEEVGRALQERRFTECSVSELQKAAAEEPRLLKYVKAIIRNPKRKRSDIWKDLGWAEEDGRAVDRKYRRLRQHLKDAGVGMEWREMPTPFGSASQTVYFETLYDGAKGMENGVWQHKSLKTEGK
jgi:hypothetical protein